MGTAQVATAGYRDQRISEAAEREKLYFVNPWVDFLLIGGFSIITFCFLKFFPTTITHAQVVLFAGAVTWLINDPHFSMTNYRLYHSKSNIQQYPMTAIVIPFIIILGVIASIQFPLVVAPFFVKLFILWSPYHFSGQSVGVTMVYSRRAGFNVGPWERRAISGFIFSAFLSTILLYETGTGVSTEHFGIPYPVLGLPTWVPIISQVVMAVCGVAILFFAGRWSIQNKRILPPIVLLPAFTHFIWFLGGSALAAFDELVPMFHSIQYILIAWATQMAETAAAKSALAKENGVDEALTFSKPWFSWMTVRWWGLNIAGGWVLFQGLPHLFPAYQSNPLLVIGVVSAGAQIHHFFVDGVIWKLKNDKNVSPLTVHIPKLLKPKTPAPAAMPGVAVGASS